MKIAINYCLEVMEVELMSMFTGLEGHETTGNLGIAVIAGVGGTITFQNFQTDADSSDLQAYLTINGDLSKRTVDLGPLPQTSGSFNLSFPEGTDMSLFNVLVVRAGDASIGEARIS
ncbi:MAG: hypothetical protein VKK04_25290 [Synechococcales bacterium]|nr:hypothetical protein [Synechococcales bacterium]